MKTKIISSGEEESQNEIEIPQLFDHHVRRDIIKKAVLSAQASRKQPKGSHPRAGMQNTAETPPKGSGQTRVRRIKGSGYRAAGRGAWAPFTSGGRRAHPPKSEKEKKEKINKKEKEKAIKSAIAATKDLDIVSNRGHEVSNIDDLPLVAEDSIQELKKTKSVKQFLEKIGAWEDVLRVKNSKKIRSGKGKYRGRKYKKKVGPLIVISEDNGLKRAGRNIPGLQILTAGEVNAESLAPGGSPGRLTIWTFSALQDIDRRFLN